MEREEILKIEDKSRIEKVVFNNPELVNENAEEIVKEKYNRMINLGNTLLETRTKVRSLEEEYKRVQEEWHRLQSFFTYSHPILEKKVTRDTCEMVIKGHGNDIIGRTTVM